MINHNINYNQMHVEQDKLVFNTGKKIPFEQEMFNISENGIFKTLGPDMVVQSHTLTKKEIREVTNFLITKIDDLTMMML